MNSQKNTTKLLVEKALAKTSEAKRKFDYEGRSKKKGKHIAHSGS
jgi:hypothetical protein